ncbi:MAG: ATP-binding protein [Parvibaculaceae bacterium]|nr:ATP-binding protein [Parvibaculaceae bacterium]
MWNRRARQERPGPLRRGLRFAAGAVAERLVPGGTKADACAALDAMDVPCAVTGPLGMLHLANNAYGALCGDGRAMVAPRELIGAGADNAPALYRLLRAARQGVEGRERIVLGEAPFEVRLMSEPGRAIWLFQLADSDDEPAAETIAPPLDPQAAKLLAIGQLAGGVAHDFNNLLTAILGYGDLLLARHPVGDPSFNDLMQIQQTANRAASLTRQLLAFSRRQVLHTRPVSLIDSLAETAHLLSRMLGERITLDIRHDRSLWRVSIDPTQLEQVILNLAVNARDAMEEGGTLTIRTQNIEAGRVPVPDAQGDFVLVEVADTGHGIEKEHLSRIFDPFFTTREAGKGTGLGLSTVHGIVHQMDGHIRVASEPGQGTRFSIYLPRYRGEGAAGSSTPVSAPLAAPPAQDMTGSGTILLVEDEDVVRTFAARALSSRGYEVIEARNGEEALSLFDESDVDLVISDVIMPGISGPDLVAGLRERRPSLKAIFVSGYTNEVLASRPEFARARFLTKPFSLKALAAAVKAELG